MSIFGMLKPPLKEDKRTAQAELNYSEKIVTPQPQDNLPPGWTIVCISDTHSKHIGIEDLPLGDILIHAGDYSSSGSEKDTREFTEWIDSQPHKHKIFIGGNHDITLDEEYYIEKGASRFHRSQKELSSADYAKKCKNYVVNCKSTYLQDSGTQITYTNDLNSKSNRDNSDCAHNVLNIYGSPWQPEFCDWAFNLNRGQPLRQKWDMIPPDDVDILITHGPPYGYGDRTASGFNCGCEDLLKVLRSDPITPPRLHIFGHIHEGYGAWFDGKTLFVNASICTFHYRPTNRPVVVHIPFDKSLPASVVDISW